MEYYSAIKKNTFESVLMRWMKLEPIIQSEVSQKEKHQYSILTLYIWNLFFIFLSVSFFIILFYFLTLQYCIGFAIYQHESATGIHAFLILKPPPTSLPVPSLWVVPVHQPQASSIVHRTWTGNSFHTWYFTCFNAILPNLPTLSQEYILILKERKKLT